MVVATELEEVSKIGTPGTSGSPLILGTSVELRYRISK